MAGVECRVLPEKGCASAKGEYKIGAAALEVEVVHEAVEACLVNADILVNAQLDSLTVFCPASKGNHQFHGGRAPPIFRENIEAMVLGNPYIGETRAGDVACQHAHHYVIAVVFGQQDTTCFGCLDGLSDRFAQFVWIEWV